MLQIFDAITKSLPSFFSMLVRTQQQSHLLASHEFSRHVSNRAHMFVTPPILQTAGEEQNSSSKEKSVSDNKPAAFRKGCLIAIAGTKAGNDGQELWIGKVLTHVKAADAAARVRWLQKENDGAWTEMDLEGTAFRDSIIDVVEHKQRKRGREYVIGAETLELMIERLGEFHVAATRPVPVNLFSGPPATPLPAASVVIDSDASPTAQEPEIATPLATHKLDRHQLADALVALRPIAHQARTSQMFYMFVGGFCCTQNKQFFYSCVIII